MNKVFGVGFSKTGTTSLEKSLAILGYETWRGHWQNPNSSYLLALYVHGDYDEIFRVVNYYDAFADGPWGGADLYLELYKRLPESRFILTIRDAESWYNSLERMITKFDSNLETALESFHENGRYGFVYFCRHIFNIETLAGNRQKIIDYYNAYNENVADFFSRNNADLLVFDMSAGGGWDELCGFLNRPIPLSEPFPWANKTLGSTHLSNTIPHKNNPKSVSANSGHSAPGRIPKPSRWIRTIRDTLGRLV
jgi:hypothetical protein